VASGHCQVAKLQPTQMARPRPSSNHSLWHLIEAQEDRDPAVGCIDGKQRSQALGVNRLAIMLTYHFSDTGGALATLDLDGDFVGDAQRIRWHVLRRYHFNAAT